MIFVKINLFMRQYLFQHCASTPQRNNDELQYKDIDAFIELKKIVAIFVANR